MEIGIPRRTKEELRRKGSRRIPRTIQLSQGAGGSMMEALIENLIAKRLDIKSSFVGSGIDKLEDAGIIDLGDIKLAFTTDGCTVDPMFYPGGSLGSLSVGATINDLAVMGAKPIAISFGLILEEGLPLDILERTLDRMSAVCKESGVPIITGDTKVMEKGKVDKLVINTAGIGIIQGDIISDYGAQPGDKILVSGTMGDHGMSLVALRFGFQSNLRSDEAPLWHMMEQLLNIGGITSSKDATRGGFSPNINELARKSNVCFYVYEDKIPIKPEAKRLGEVLGIDPLSTACEGKIIMTVEPAKADEILETMRHHKYGKEAAIIGEVRRNPKGQVMLETEVGGRKALHTPVGELHPRIC
ncbi:hydrogenase expression/formation protein HypE [bacterium]|nr:hydrogenase expression/formation protein HypE [bacterium]